MICKKLCLFEKYEISRGNMFCSFALKITKFDSKNFPQSVKYEMPSKEELGRNKFNKNGNRLFFVLKPGSGAKKKFSRWV